MSDCMATARVVNGVGDEAELFCSLFSEHDPPIHWDKQVGVHWFRMEEQPGAALVYGPPPTLDK